MPEILRSPEYDAGIETRLVAPNGYISWKGALLRVTGLLSSQPVGLRLIDEDEWELLYGPLVLGYVLLRDGKLRIEQLR
jgi:hypothetical protein